MKHSDIAFLMKGAAPVLREYLVEAVAPLQKRIAELEAQVAAIPAGRDGKDGSDGAKGMDGAPGKDGRDGVDGKPGEKGLDGAHGRDGLNGKDGATGRGITKLLTDAKGHLMVTYSDGVVEDVGVIVGKDGADGRDGRDGRDGIDGVAGEKGEAGADGRDGVDGRDGAPGADGKSVDPETVVKMVSEAIEGAGLGDLVQRAVDAIPRPKDGSDGPQGPAGKDGQDGKSVDPAEVANMVRAEVEKAAIPDLVSKAVSAIPKPRDGMDGAPGERGEKGEPGAPGERGLQGEKGQDGRSVSPADLVPLIDERLPALISEAVKAIPVPKDGKDGLGFADGMLDRDGNLVLTMTDGRHKSLGVVVGKDGAPGPQGERGEPGAVGERGLPGDRGPIGEKGDAGKDGLDGLGFDDMTLEYDGERALTVCFEKGDVRKEFPMVLPIVLDRGVWQERGIEGAGYKKGDAVSWGGSLYIARKDTFAKPDDFDAWRLSVKRGKDAKEPVNLK